MNMTVVVSKMVVACSVFTAVAGPAFFENPVIRTNWPDPTFWRHDGVFYSVATGLDEIRTSRALLRWEPTSPVVDAATKSNLVSFSANLWAPDAVKIGGEWRIYVTQFVTSDTNRLVCLSAKNPGGPFCLRSVVIDNRDFGIRDLAVDAEVVVDADRIWLFTGSVAGGIHRFELTADGLAVKTRMPAHVAGLLPNDHDRKWIYSHACYEGAYLFRRDDWWYLFVSSGSIVWDGYHLCCGRSRTLDGDFVDSKGVSLANGGGDTLIVSNDEFPGPGHNGEIVTDREGRDYMFFHSHWSAFPQDGIDFQRRCLNLQRIYWKEDGWPYFKTGSTVKRETVPQLEGE